MGFAMPCSVSKPKAPCKGSEGKYCSSKMSARPLFTLWRAELDDHLVVFTIVLELDKQISLHRTIHPDRPNAPVYAMGVLYLQVVV